MDPWKVYLIGAIPVAIAVSLLLWGFSSLRRKRMIENLPTSKVAGVFIGLTEVKGDAETPRPLRSYLAEQACVYFSYSIEEEWERWETETYTDDKGNTRTRRVKKSGWTTVQSAEERPPFFLRDDTGALRIDPEGAKVEAEHVFSRTVGRGDPLYYGKGPGGGIVDSTGRRSFSESAIALGRRLYVVGCARLRQDEVAPEIARDPEGELFLISTRDEAAVKRGLALAAFFKLLFGLLFAAAAPLLFWGIALEDAGRALREHWPAMVDAAVVFAVVVGAYYLQLLYNGLVSVRNRVKNAWSQIDIQLKRRHDLIPALVSSVQGYAKHEKDVHESLAKIGASAAGPGGGAVPALPTGAQAAALATIANVQTSALRGLFGLAERYPELKADAGYRDLMAELSQTETKIALARAFFNESVTAYNDRVQTLPDAIVAKLAGMRPTGWFEIEEIEKRPVPVKAAAEA